MEEESINGLDYRTDRWRRCRLAGQHGDESGRLDGHLLEHRGRLRRLLIGNALSGPLFGVRGSVQAFSLTGLVIAFVGAVVLLAIVNLIQRGRVR